MPHFNLDGKTQIDSLKSIQSQIESAPSTQYHTINVARDTPITIIASLLKLKTPPESIHLILGNDFEPKIAKLIAFLLRNFMRFTPPETLRVEDEEIIRSIANRIGESKTLLLPNTSSEVARLYAMNLGKSGMLLFNPLTPPNIIEAAVSSLSANTQVAILPETPEESILLIASVMPQYCTLNLPVDITIKTIEKITKILPAKAIIRIPKYINNEAIIQKVASCIPKNAGGLAVSTSLSKEHLQLAAQTIIQGVPLILDAFVPQEKVLAVAQSMQKGGILMLRTGVHESVVLAIASIINTGVLLSLEGGTTHAEQAASQALQRKVNAILVQRLHSDTKKTQLERKMTQTPPTSKQNLQSVEVALVDKNALLEKTPPRVFPHNILLPTPANAAFFSSKASVPTPLQTEKDPTPITRPTAAVPSKRKASASKADAEVAKVAKVAKKTPVTEKDTGATTEATTEATEIAQILCSLFTPVIRKPSDPREPSAAPKTPSPSTLG